MNEGRRHEETATLPDSGNKNALKKRTHLSLPTASRFTKAKGGENRRMEHVENIFNYFAGFVGHWLLRFQIGSPHPYFAGSRRPGRDRSVTGDPFHRLTLIFFPVPHITAIFSQTF